jgi:hypothetical protein
VSGYKCSCFAIVYYVTDPFWAKAPKLPQNLTTVAIGQREIFKLGGDFKKCFRLPPLVLSRWDSPDLKKILA